jgi:predicted methyltransferase
MRNYKSWMTNILIEFVIEWSQSFNKYQDDEQHNATLRWRIHKKTQKKKAWSI